jgi:hypothetical protein
VQSGVNPGQYLVPSHKVRRIHHPNVWCPHLFFFSPSEKTTQKQSRQIKNLPHKMTLRTAIAYLRSLFLPVSLSHAHTHTHANTNKGM